METSRTSSAVEETGLIRNSLTAEPHRLDHPRTFACAVSMMIGTSGKGKGRAAAAPGARIRAGWARHRTIEMTTSGAQRQMARGRCGVLSLVIVLDADHLQQRPRHLAHGRLVIDDENLQRFKLLRELAGDRLHEILQCVGGEFPASEADHNFLIWREMDR